MTAPTHDLEATRDFYAGCQRDRIPLADYECEHNALGECRECDAAKLAAELVPDPKRGRRNTAMRAVLAAMLAAQPKPISVDAIYRALGYECGQPKDSFGRPTSRSHTQTIRRLRAIVAPAGWRIRTHGADGFAVVYAPSEPLTVHQVRGLASDVREAREPFTDEQAARFGRAVLAALAAEYDAAAEVRT